MSRIQVALNERLQEAVNNLACWEESKARFGDIEAALDDAFGDRLTLGFVGSFDVSLTGNKEDLNTLFRILRAEGWEPSSRPEEPASYWSSFWHKEGLNLLVWTSFSSTVCKRVKIGTETKEVDIYEVRCDE